MKALRIAYIGVGLLVLAIVLGSFAQYQQKDIGIVLGYCMLILTFPSGFLMLAFLGFVLMPIGDALGLTLGFGYAYIILYWIAFLLVGYFQWFKLVPAIWRRIRRKSYVASN
jgi:hypothetical protein